MAQKVDRKFFFDKWRAAFGALNSTQVAGLDAILDAVDEFKVFNPYHFGAVIATVRIEVGSQMYPVREGFAKTDAGARAAVKKLYQAGVISRNYALSDAETGQSYYGRGFPQTTHKENYLKTGTALGVGDMFVKNPDLLLLPKWAARGMVVMMQKGLYRPGNSLVSRLGTFPHVPSRLEIFMSREIINGDKNKYRDGRKIGDTYADYVVKFANMLKTVEIGVATTGNGTEIIPAEELDVTFTVDKPTPAPQLSRWERLLNWLTSL